MHSPHKHNVAMDTRSPSPSRIGKRKVVQAQDSISEPPRKSPAARLFEPGSHRFRFDQDSLAETSGSAGSPGGGDTPEGAYSSAPHPSPAFSLSGASRPVAVPPSPRSSQASFSFPPLTSSSTGTMFKTYRERRNSKDVLDEYFSKRAARRRSSCKEITLSFFPPCAGALPRMVCPEESDPSSELYETIETRRRLSLGNVLREVDPPYDDDDDEDDVAISDSEIQEVQDRQLTPTGNGNTSGFSRSLSAEGYDPEDQRERKQETQALLFDSTPDLTIEENYIRFPSIRSSRRGAVCYDIQTPLLALQSLDLEKL